MPNRPRPAAAIGYQAALLLLITAAVHAQSSDALIAQPAVITSERIVRDGVDPLDVRYQVSPELSGRMPRITTTTTAAVTLLQHWFGALPTKTLTMAIVPWRQGAWVRSQPGEVTIPVRWLAPVRDRSTERAVIVALVEQYWPADTADSWRDSLVRYTAARSIHHLLEGVNFASPRFFGGSVPFPLRSLLLSGPASDPQPRVTDFPEFAPASVATERGVRALQSLERYIGWPAMLDAISRLRIDRASSSPDAFASIVSDVRGTDMRFLLKELFRSESTFDYAIQGMEERTIVPGRIETTVTVVRRGSGKFAIQDDETDRDPAVPVRIRFADGREVRERIDGVAASTTLTYTAPVAAISAAVDPDVFLLQDTNRDNNVVVREPRTSKLAIRLALHWLSWLQNAMLSYSALV